MVSKTKAAPIVASKPSLGALIDQLWAVREEKRLLEAQVKETEKRISELNDSLIAQLDEQGLDKATGKKASLSISETVEPDVQDWDVLFPWIAKNKQYQLLRRQLNSAAYRELLEAGKKIPATQPFPKRKLNLRTL